MCQRAAVGLGALHAAVCAWDLLKEVAIIFRASLVVQRLKCLPPMQETQVRSLGLIPGFNPWVGRIPWRRKWQPTPVFLPGECHGWRSLVGYSPQGLNYLHHSLASGQMIGKKHSPTINRKLNYRFTEHLYAGQETTVRTRYETTDSFQIGKGVRQGFISSPCLFNLYAEYILRNAGLYEAYAGFKTSGRNINNLRYADDITLMAEGKE